MQHLVIKHVTKKPKRHECNVNAESKVRLTNYKLPSNGVDCPAGILCDLKRWRFCQDRNLRIIVLIPVKGPKIKQITRYDAFSAKVPRSKLVFAGDDARARHFWCRSNLQRDF